MTSGFIFIMIKKRTYMDIHIQNLDFAYKKEIIFHQLNASLHFNKDCIVLMGHNGAGKTTLFNLICGILTPQSGKISISKPNDIAYLPYDSNLYFNLTVIANIKFWYQIYNNQSLNLNDAFFNELIDCLKLRQLLNKKCIHLSSGEEKKVAFLIAILSHSKLMILDDPFNGIDPISTIEITNLINSLTKKGFNFLISSHQLDILEKVATQYIIMKDYKIIEMNYKNKINNESFYKKYKEIYGDESHENMVEYI